MCSANSGRDFFRPWNGTKVLAKLPSINGDTDPDNDRNECESGDETDTTMSQTSNTECPTTGSLHMLSNFVMNSKLNCYNSSSNCSESDHKLKQLNRDSSSSDSNPSVARASPESAFTVPLPYADFLSTLRNDITVPYDTAAFEPPPVHHIFQYNLAALPLVHYKNIEEAAKLIHQQDVAAKQIKKSRPKKFSCKYCSQLFSNNGQLKGHIRIHTGERPFKCDAQNCGKSFTRNEELTRHKRIHTGVRPHACFVCGKRFGRKDHLKKHTRTHENRVHPLNALPPFAIGHPAPLFSTSASAFPSPYLSSTHVYPLFANHIAF